MYNTETVRWKKPSSVNTMKTRIKTVRFFSRTDGIGMREKALGPVKLSRRLRVFRLS